MAQYLETDNYRSFRFTHDSSIPLNHGELYLLNDTVGMIFVANKLDPTTGCQVTLDVEEGEVGVLIYQAEKIRVPKAAGLIINEGQAIYWDGIPANGVTNVWATGLYWIGICIEPSPAAHTRVLIDLLGNKATAEEAPGA